MSSITLAQTDLEIPALIHGCPQINGKSTLAVLWPIHTRLGVHALVIVEHKVNPAHIVPPFKSCSASPFHNLRDSCSRSWPGWHTQWVNFWETDGEVFFFGRKQRRWWLPIQTDECFRNLVCLPLLYYLGNFNAKWCPGFTGVQEPSTKYRKWLSMAKSTLATLLSPHHSTCQRRLSGAYSM